MVNETLQIIFSGIVTISTVVYSILTWQLVSETRRTREFQMTPDVNIFFERAEADASFVHIVFKNFGLGHAKNVRFKIIRDFEFYDFEHLQLKKLKIINDGIETFYSKQEHKYYLADLSNDPERKKQEILIIEVEYDSITNKHTKKIFNLTFSEIEGKSIFNPPDNYIGLISYELKEIKKIMANFYKEQNS